MPVGLFRGEEAWVQVDYRTGATIPVPRSKYEDISRISINRRQKRVLGHREKEGG
jgi:hypothetical protein